MRIGVYVGSFNPLHIGHQQVINTLITKKIVDKVLVIPTNSYWDKKVDINIKHRINMLKLIENENVIVDGTLSEIKYTYQILDVLKEKYSDLYLVIGADNIINFHEWKNVDKILENHIIVFNRDGIDVNKYLTKFDKAKFIIIDKSPINISSTYIRERIKNRDYESIEGMIDNRILNYIKKNNLYY